MADEARNVGLGPGVELIEEPETLEEAVRRKAQKELEGERRNMLINFGPQHPSTHGVLRVLLTVEGETVIDAQPDIGYLHRNWEKIVEGWTFPMVVPFSDRNDYLAAIANEQAVVSAVERLMEIDVPERAKYLRLLVFELQRIASHLMAVGTFGMDMGAVTPFLYAWRDREKIYSLFEELTGARMLYNYLRIGGLRNDVPDGWLQRLEEFLDYFENQAYPQYWDVLLKNEIFIRRTKGVAVLSKEDAIAYGASGPVLRGSGIKWDLRKQDPFLPYDKIEFDVPVGENGDAYDRTIVRAREMKESIKIIRQVLKLLPDGPVMAKMPRALRPPKGHVISRTESPRGEIGVYLVSDGKPNPYRIKWRAPSFVHLQLLPLISRGHLIADLVVCIGSLDVVLGEVDR